MWQVGEFTEQIIVYEKTIKLTREHAKRHSKSNESQIGKVKAKQTNKIKAAKSSKAVKWQQAVSN